MKKFYQKKRFWVNGVIAIISGLALQLDSIRAVSSEYGELLVIVVAGLNAFLSVTSKEILAEVKE